MVRRGRAFGQAYEATMDINVLRNVHFRIVFALATACLATSTGYGLPCYGLQGQTTPGSRERASRHCIAGRTSVPARWATLTHGPPLPLPAALPPRPRPFATAGAAGRGAPRPRPFPIAGAAGPGAPRPRPFAAAGTAGTGAAPKAHGSTPCVIAVRSCGKLHLQRRALSQPWSISKRRAIAYFVCSTRDMSFQNASSASTGSVSK